MFLSINDTNAQVPINCGGLNCTTEPWIEENTITMMVNDCMVNPQFKLNKCCDITGCTYFIETSILLLQKIEELTLYVIELKKENEIIKKKLEQKR